MSNCSEEGLYLNEEGTTLLLIVPIVILGITAISVIAGCVCGCFGWCWCYEVIASMSTGVVIKLALVPDVDDVILEQKCGEGTTVTVQGEESTRVTVQGKEGSRITIQGGEGTTVTVQGEEGIGVTIKVGEGTTVTVQAGKHTTVDVQDGENPLETVGVRRGKAIKVVGTTVAGVGATVIEEDGEGTGVTVKARGGSAVTVQGREGTAVTVQGGEGIAVTVQGGEGTAVTVQAGEGTAVTVKAGEGTAITLQDGVNTPKTVHARKGKTIKVVGTTVTKKSQSYCRICLKETVFFQTYSGHKMLHFWVNPFTLPFLLGSGMLLVMSYGAVFITSHWKITKNCNNSCNEFGIRMSCYRLNLCPPVNCTTWNNRSAWINNNVTLKNNTTWNNCANWMENQSGENLFCLSLSPDLITTLVNFVSIYAVQVALMQLFACIVNKGCCLPFRYPPCRYTTICIMNSVLGISVLALTVAAWVTVFQGGTIFQTLAIPLFHLLFVLLSVCAIQ